MHMFNYLDKGCAHTIKDNTGSRLSKCTKYSCRGWVGRTIQRSLHTQVVEWNGGGTLLTAHPVRLIRMR
jgi:hypothetical protein